MQSDYTYREFRTRTIMQSIIPIFVNAKTTKTPHYLHHTSVYAITEQEAKIQTRLGNTKNRPVTHYSSEIIVDADNQSTAEKVWDNLCANDIYFELYKLNNYKFYLQRDKSDQPSDMMCYQDRQYVRDSLWTCNVDNGLDLGIYSSPFHLCRAKGSLHEVTNARSVLIETHKGSNLVSTNHIELKKLQKPLSYNSAPETNYSDWSQLQYIIEFCNGVKTNKHNALFKFAASISKFCSFDVGLELAMIYAKSIDYCLEKATRAFTQGYPINA